MFAEFFHKKVMMRIACAISVWIAMSCMGYAYSLSKVKSVEMNESFYFLVSNDTRVEASAEFVKWEGGAGYLLEHDGAQYVAFAVFLEKTEGEKVHKRLDKSTTLIQKGKLRLYFKGKQKERQGLYVSALKLFKSYMLLLEDCIGRLEFGMTQEACKRILKVIERQFNYSKETYGEYTPFAKACGQSGEILRAICAQTVYLKDLRYLLCWQAEKYVELCKAFSL